MGNNASSDSNTYRFVYCINEMSFSKSIDIEISLRKVNEVSVGQECVYEQILQSWEYQQAQSFRLRIQWKIRLYKMQLGNTFFSSWSIKLVNSFNLYSGASSTTVIRAPTYKFNWEKSVSQFLKQNMRELVVTWSRKVPDLLVDSKNSLGSPLFWLRVFFSYFIVTSSNSSFATFFQSTCSKQLVKLSNSASTKTYSKCRWDFRQM